MPLETIEVVEIIFCHKGHGGFGNENPEVFTDRVISDFREILVKAEKLREKGFRITRNPFFGITKSNETLLYRFEKDSASESADKPEQEEEAQTDSAADPTNPILSRTIEELELSIRSYNVLKNAGFQTVGDIVKFNRNEFLRIKNMGRRSLNEIEELLAGLGLRLANR